MPPADQTKNSASFAHTKSSAATMPPSGKKKVTSHWRSFIRPLMWRCKWAELKIKQLESIASSCTKTIDQNEHLVDQSLSPEFGSSSSSSSMRVNEMDPNLYMSNHILFSYHENGASETDDFDDLVMRDSEEEPEEVDFDMHNKRLFVEDKDDDMLRKIDTAQTRIQKLKAQLDVVISKNVNPFEAQISTQFGFHIPESMKGLPSQVADSYENANSS